jgi:uncharacterized membrane protein
MESWQFLHGQFVHFPIALLLTYVLFEIIGILTKREFFSKAAHLILLLGVIGLICAVLTGNQAEQLARKMHKSKTIFSAIKTHSNYANITLWYFAALLVIRTILVLKKKFFGYLKYSFIILSLAGLFLVFETGKFGGKLVYDYGVGTNSSKIEITK